MRYLFGSLFLVFAVARAFTLGGWMPLLLGVTTGVLGGILVPIRHSPPYLSNRTTNWGLFIGGWCVGALLVSLLLAEFGHPVFELPGILISATIGVSGLLVARRLPSL